MILRSDEEANQAEVERDRKLRGNIGKGISAASSLATAAIASPLASKVMPFLNQYIPPALAMKGIEKVSPKLGSFLKKGQKMGLDVQEGLDFIKDKFDGEKKESPKENRNIIQQYSPELHQFIDQQVKSGRSAIEAGAIAQADKRFSGIINKLSKDHKTPWSNILESVYGKGDMAQPNQQQEQQQGQGIDPGVAKILEQGTEILNRARQNRG
jgi:hypothetical protein